MFQKKSLGQNFLRNKSLIHDVISAGEVSGEDVVLEIGPGEGSLTEELLKKAGKVITVEKDDRLIPYLQNKFKNEISSGKLDLIHADILSSDSLNSKLQVASYKLIANLPYYITGEILRKFLESENQPSLMVLMVQKEVAERIVSRDKKESILSLSVKAYGKPEYIKTVSAGNFSPVPNVDSAILKIGKISKNFFESFQEKKFFETIKTAFKSKRKICIGNLSSIYPKDALEKIFDELKISQKARAEDISLSNWQKIVQKLTEFSEN